MSSRKCVIVIAGVPDDLYFGHACYIAESLSKILENFNFKRIVINLEEWNTWLEQICYRWGWCHTKSPLIWREIGISGSNVTYIGGANQFWKFLNLYYNLCSCFTQDELQTLKLDLLSAYDVELRLTSVEKQKQFRHITIIGAGRSLCLDLVPQLLMTKELWLSHGVIIKLYDEPGCFFKTKQIARDSEAIGGNLHAVEIIESVSDGLSNCDILINVDAISREEQDGSIQWLGNNYESMKDLAHQINQYAPSHMKVIFCSTGPSCFCVNVLHALITKIEKSNIVAVSAHYGLEIVYNFVKSLGFSPKNIGCPPVWGYLGINQFVDTCHMIQKYDVYRPNKKALTAKKNTTLSLGVKRSELRWFFYMSHDKNPYIDYVQRKAITLYQVGRTEDFQKCKAICDLLKLWYADDIGDEIISLGISSDGSFGLPQGLVFSQPVCMKKLDDQSRIWIPFVNFPLPHMPMSIYQNLIDTAMILLTKCIK